MKVEIEFWDDPYSAFGIETVKEALLTSSGHPVLGICNQPDKEWLFLKLSDILEKSSEKVGTPI